MRVREACMSPCAVASLLQYTVRRERVLPMTRWRVRTPKTCQKMLASKDSPRGRPWQASLSGRDTGFSFQGPSGCGPNLEVSTRAEEIFHRFHLGPLEMLQANLSSLFLWRLNGSLATGYWETTRDGKLDTTHLTMFAKSAPEKPGVPRAKIFGSTPKDQVRQWTRWMASSHLLGEVVTFRIWCWRICARPLISGRGTVTCLSNRPGRTKALSKEAGWVWDPDSLFNSRTDRGSPGS